MSITWNGVSSDTIGVIVERIPNRYVPTRRFSPQQVAGRNGNILLVDKSFPNVEQEYEVYLSAEAQGLPSVARACAEWLMGPDGYCRLEDSYDTTVYREAFLMGGYDLENILNKFGRCTITFSCKPQKYLLTGDTPISIPAGTTTTYTGSSVQFDGITGASITSLSTTITPTQDLHGYAKPWPGGGGTNKLPNLRKVATTRITIGQEEAYTDLMIHLTAGTYTLAITHTVANGPQVYARHGGTNTQLGTLTVGAGTNAFTFTVDSDTNYSFSIYRSSGVDSDSIAQFWLVSGSDAGTYTPYENICPISGLTGLSVYRSSKNLLNTDLVGEINSTATNVRQGIYWTIPGTYTVSASGSGIVCRKKSADGTYGTANYLPTTFTETITDGEAIIIFNPTNGASKDTTVALMESTNVMLEVGSSASTYESYSGNTYAVDWSTQAGTVYHGTVDVVSGELTVDMVNIQSYNGETINEPWLSSMDAYAAGTTPTIGAQVVYTLATPLTYQLTPQEIGVLVGENNVWSSSGPVSATVVTPLGGVVTNPTPFEARPLLEVSGLGEITINGKSIQILESVSDFQIDCEAMEAEDNSKIYCVEFPELSGGENEIVGDGSITALTVTPRWWTL